MAESHIGLTHSTDPSDYRPLTGRVACVTGSSRGIGQTIAHLLGQRGADVAVTYSSNAALADEIVAHLQESHKIKAKAYQCDVADYAQATTLMEQIKVDFGGVDFLINNAGITRDRSFRKMTPEDWHRVIDVNLTGVFNCCHAALLSGALRLAPTSRIIGIGSIIGREGNFGQSNYAASKSGLFGLTKTLAREFARNGVTVNSVAPGFIETDMLEGVPEDVRKKLIDNIPLGRFGTPREIAHAVAYLCSEPAGWITGAVLDINGGQYM